MKIEVTNNESREIIFEGDADDFLEQNDYNEELEEALNELDSKEVGDTINIYGMFTDVFTVEKLVEEMED